METECKNIYIYIAQKSSNPAPDPLDAKEVQHAEVISPLTSQWLNLHKHNSHLRPEQLGQVFLKFWEKLRYYV